MLGVGFDVSNGERDEAWFVKMRHNEHKIGQIGFIAIRLMLRMSRKDLWQFYILDRAHLPRRLCGHGCVCTG
jgi:hypothetical protein